MKQLKMTALAIALSTAAASSAMAQSAKTNAWEGAYAQLGVGYATVTPSIGNGTVTNLTSLGYPSIYNNSTSTASADNLGSATGNIAAGYNFGLNSDYVLGIGAAYYPGATSAANASFIIASPINGSPLPTDYAKYQMKNLWSVTLAPGYVIDKDRLAYFKVGYTGVTMGVNGPTVAYQTAGLSGYTLGLGYKQMVTQSIYLLGEINYANFSKKTASIQDSRGPVVTAPIGASGADFLVGLGYRF